MGFLRRFCPCFRSPQPSRVVPPQTAPPSLTRRFIRLIPRKLRRRGRTIILPRTAGYQAAHSFPIPQPVDTSARRQWRQQKAMLRPPPLPRSSSPSLSPTRRRRSHRQPTRMPSLQDRWNSSGTRKKVVWGEQNMRYFTSDGHPSRRTFDGQYAGSRYGTPDEYGMGRHLSSESSEDDEESSLLWRPIRRKPSRRPRRRIHSYEPEGRMPMWSDGNGFLSPNPYNRAQIPVQDRSYATRFQSQPEQISRYRQLLYPSLRLKRPGEYPVISWDILWPSSTAVQYSFASRFALAQYCAPSVLPIDVSARATHPLCHTMGIAIESSALASWTWGWGHVVVRGTNSDSSITVKDVLDAIYRYFHTPLMEEDLSCLPYYLRGALGDARSRRLALTAGSPTSPASLGSGWDAYGSYGYMRVDLLNGCTRFAGLRQLPEAGSVRYALVLVG